MALRLPEITWRHNLILFIFLSSLLGAVWAYRAVTKTRYSEGVDLLRSNQVDEAEALFDELASAGDLQGLYGLAWAAYRKGNHDQAGFYADYIVGKAKGNLQAAAFYLQGSLDMMSGYFQRARGRFRQALSVYRETGNEEGIFRSSMRFAEVSLLVEDSETARAILTSLESDEVEASGYYWYLMSQSTFSMGDPDLAQAQIQKSIDLFIAAEDAGGQANALAEWGWLEGALESGLEKTREALELAGTPKQETYFTVNLFYYERCTGGDPDSLAFVIDSVIRDTGDRILTRFFDKAENHACER